MQSKSWLGKLLAGVTGALLLLVTLFFSILIFGVIASLLVAVIVYLVWSGRSARGTVQRRVTDKVIKHDIG